MIKRQYLEGYVLWSELHPSGKERISISRCLPDEAFIGRKDVPA